MIFLAFPAVFSHMTHCLCSIPMAVHVTAALGVPRATGEHEILSSRETAASPPSSAWSGLCRSAKGSRRRPGGATHLFVEFLFVCFLLPGLLRQASFTVGKPYRCAVSWFFRFSFPLNLAILLRGCDHRPEPLSAWLGLCFLSRLLCRKLASDLRSFYKCL